MATVSAQTEDKKPIEFAKNHLNQGFIFGEWSVLSLENKLVRGDKVVKLEPKVMQLLLLLTSQHDKPCTRAELLDQLWPSPETGESSLTRAISELRKALGDQRNPARYIDTIQRIGYKAIAPIRPLRSEQTQPLDSGTNNFLSPNEEVTAMARYLLARRNGSDIRRAIKLLSDYLEHDPYHSQVSAMLAYAESIVHLYSNEPAALHIRKANEHAYYAIKLDSSNGLAWSVLGSLAHHYWQWQEALERYERAYAYQPDDPMILNGYAELCLNLGRIAQAQALIRRSCSLEPLAAGAHMVLGWMLLHGHEEQSKKELTKARQLGADTVFADNLECLLLHRTGWDERAVRRWADLNQQRQEEPGWMWPKYLLDALIDTGPTAALVSNIRERVHLGQLDSGIAPFMLATANAVDAAFDMTKPAIEVRSFFIIDPWLKEMDAFRADARFPKLLDQLALTELI